MSETTKKPAAKAVAKKAEAAHAAPASKAEPKKAPAKAAKSHAAEADAAKTDTAKKAPAKAAKAEKGTSTKGPTKSAPGSSEKPKAKPAQQPPSAFSKPLTPSKELAAVLGDGEPLPRTLVVSKVWEYIKAHKLQNEANKREILADDKLKPIFGKDKVTMFEMNKYLNAHLKG